jgi:hypothetical protein
VSPAVAAELAVWALLNVPAPPRVMLVIAGAKQSTGEATVRRTG